jgi:hypothetical protein
MHHGGIVLHNLRVSKRAAPRLHDEAERWRLLDHHVDAVQPGREEIGWVFFDDLTNDLGVVEGKLYGVPSPPDVSAPPRGGVEARTKTALDHWLKVILLLRAAARTR